MQTSSLTNLLCCRPSERVQIVRYRSRLTAQFSQLIPQCLPIGGTGTKKEVLALQLRKGYIENAEYKLYASYISVVLYSRGETSEA